MTADRARRRHRHLLVIIARQRAEVASLQRCLDASFRVCLELHGRQPIAGERRLRLVR